jgi:hypothetical protein
MKKQTEEFLLEIIYEQYPQVKGKVAFVDSGTPLTNNFYLGTLNGEVLPLPSLLPSLPGDKSAAGLWLGALRDSIQFL